MTVSHAVIIPFGVPTEARGLGLGLAALFHSFTVVQGQLVGLAQLHARAPEDAAGREGGGPAPLVGPVETFLPPDAWRELVANGGGLSEVSIVVTGAFEPPGEGKGMLHLLAFDAKDGKTRARVEAHIDGARAGATLLSAFNEVWDTLGGELGKVRDFGDLGWDVLESMVRAERCALHDPLRNGPHDARAAMLHLGRAVGDAPLALLPAVRLAVVALETAQSSLFDPRLAEAALRALDRASADAPGQLDLLEATAAVHARLGHPEEAEAHAAATIDRAPDRPLPYAILCESRRTRGDLEGALKAVDAGLRQVRDDGLLATERATVLALRGDLAGAELGWKRVLSRDSVYPPAFVSLASMATQKNDLLLAQTLVDAALAAPHARPDVLRQAIQLAVATEPEGMSRAARIAKLASQLVARAPADAWACLVLAQARVRLGEAAVALEGFKKVMALAPTTALAAEAQREHLACSDPQASLEIEAILRAAETARVEDLEGVAARGRSLAEAHSVWTADFACGTARKRLGQLTAARAAFESALVRAPGATPAHLELTELCIASGDAPGALEHAERVLVLEGKTPRALMGLTLAQDAAGKTKEAKETARAALAIMPADERLLTILAGKEPEPPPPPSFWERLRTKVVG